MTASIGTKACRLCLTMDSELIVIDIQLENSMRSILGQNITYESGLPKYACNDCLESLKRFKDFREKCLIAQTVLYQILKTTGQVSCTEISKLNRKRLKLDTQRRPDPEKILSDTLSSKDRFLDMITTKENVSSEVNVVKLELESMDTDAEESDNDFKSNVIFETFEEESEVLLDTAGSHEEENTNTEEEISEEITLPPEHADLSEGFYIFLRPASSLSEFTSEEYQHRTYKCRRCSFSATDVKMARNHRQQKHNDRIYSCCYCSFRTDNPSSFLCHVRARYPRQVVCVQCGACFDARRGLKVHTGMQHAGGRPSVKLKSKKSELSKKVKKQVQADPKLLCTKCDVQFSTHAAWRRHVDGGHVEFVEEESKKKEVNNHSFQALQKAFYAVKSKQMGVRQAARYFNIPRSTLQCRVKNDSFKLSTKRGPPPVFNEEEEGLLVDFVKSEGCLRARDVLAEAAMLTRRLKREKFFKGGAPGHTWYKNFLRRHPELSKYRTN